MRYQFFLNQEKDREGRLVGMVDGYRAGHEMELAYAGEVPAPWRTLKGEPDYLRTLEDLYREFNLDPPRGYHGRSMSVGDVVVLGPGTDQVSAWAVARFGFERLVGFTFEVPSRLPGIQKSDSRESDIRESDTAN